MNLLPIQTTTQGGVTLTLESISDDFKFGDIEYKNEPLFFTKSIGETLGFSDINDTIRNGSLEEGCDYIIFDGAKLKQLKELLNSQNNNPGVDKRTPSLIMLTEPGLYGLLFKSKKPAAVKFRQWLAREVIPSIRKTGSYSIGNDFRKASEQMRGAVELAKLLGLSGEQAIVCASDMVKKVYGFDSLKISGVSYLETETKDGYHIVTKIGENLVPEMSAMKVNKLLKSLGYQDKINGKWVLLDKGKKYGKVFAVGNTNAKITPTSIRWKQDIVAVLQEIIDTTK